MSDLVADAVDVWLVEQPPEARPFAVITFGEGGTRPGVDLDGNALR